MQDTWLPEMQGTFTIPLTDIERLLTTVLRADSAVASLATSFFLSKIDIVWKEVREVLPELRVWWVSGNPEYLCVTGTGFSFSY